MNMELMREIIRAYNEKFCGGEEVYTLEEGVGLTLIHASHKYHKENYTVFAVQVDNETFMVRVADVNNQLHVIDCKVVTWAGSSEE